MSDIPNNETIKTSKDCQNNIGMSKTFNSVIKNLNAAIAEEDNEDKLLALKNLKDAYINNKKEMDLLS